jgi:hypothetical protein
MYSICNFIASYIYTFFFWFMNCVFNVTVNLSLRTFVQSMYIFINYLRIFTMCLHYYGLVQSCNFVILSSWTQNSFHQGNFVNVITNTQLINYGRVVYTQYQHALNGYLLYECIYVSVRFASYLIGYRITYSSFAHVNYMLNIILLNSMFIFFAWKNCIKTYLILM